MYKTCRNEHWSVRTSGLQKALVRSKSHWSVMVRTQYWITNTKQACMGSDAICVPYLLLLLPSGFDLIAEPEVLIGVWWRGHPVCDRAALSVDREITLTQPPLRAPKPGITSQPQPASQLNIGTQLTSREQTWHQSHAVAWFLNFTSYNLKHTEKTRLKNNIFNSHEH